MARILVLLSLLSCILMAAALDVVGKVDWNDVCPNVDALGQSRVVLDNGKMSGGITRNGRFVIPDVPAGTYMLSVISHDYFFDQLRVDVIDSTVEVRPYVSGTPFDPPSNILLSYPITLTPKQKHDYFIPPESFDIVKMMSNPMMLMMVFGGGMMLAMPYLMKNMDPESLQEFKEQQAKMAGLQNAMASGDLKSGISALMAAADEEPIAQQTASGVGRPGSSSKNRTNKKGRR